MKKKLFVKVITLGLTAWVSMGLMTACHDSDSSDEQKAAPKEYHPIDASTSTLRDIIEKTEYDPTTFGDVLGEWPMLSYSSEGIAKLMKSSLKLTVRNRLPQMDALFKERVGTGAKGARQWNLKRYVFTYKSVSGVTGNDTILVGSVIFPTNTVGKAHQVDMLTLYHHQAYYKRTWLPSHAVTMMALHALHNSAVIEPDGQGAQSKMEDLIRENLQGDLTALQMADCVLAALEVMKQDNVTLAADGYSNNWGTSLGTVAATGFAQYMERDATPDLKQLIKLRATYIGEGPTMLSQVRGYEDKVANPPVQKFYNGWYPSLPYYMSCCPDDKLINYDELKSYYNQLRIMPDGAANVKVKWLELNLPPAVVTILNTEQIRERLGNNSVHLVASIVSLYAASVAKDPADVENF